MHMLFYTESLYPREHSVNTLYTHAFVKFTNFIMYFGDSNVLITESDKVISNICLFLSFLKLFVLLSGGCADEANGREEQSFYIIICCLS